jgi:hypothetical protein
MLRGVSHASCATAALHTLNTDALQRGANPLPKLDCFSKTQYFHPRCCWRVPVLGLHGCPPPHHHHTGKQNCAHAPPSWVQDDQRLPRCAGCCDCSGLACPLAVEFNLSIYSHCHPPVLTGLTPALPHAPPCVGNNRFTNGSLQFRPNSSHTTPCTGSGLKWCKHDCRVVAAETKGVGQSCCDLQGQQCTAAEHGVSIRACLAHHPHQRHACCHLNQCLSGAKTN